MSESGQKKNKGRAQGWEEAGGEFYQERYVSDWDKQLPTNTSVITTLLPSKQSRFGTTKHNTKGNHSKLRKNSVWQPTATTATVHTGGTRRNEMQFAVLPDLSQVLTDEERIWEEILQIKLMPVSMQQKKGLKASLQSVTKLRLQGFHQFKWQHRKAWTKIGIKWYELWSKMKLWQSSLKQIEGHFGTGVMAYFILIRWLFFINCISFALIFLLIILPNIIISEIRTIEINSENNITQITTTSTTTMTPTTAYSTTPLIEENIMLPILNLPKIIDVLQNTDLIHNSLMFYGAYSNEIIVLNELMHNNNNSNNSTTTSLYYYDLPLAYVLVNVFCFILALIAIVVAAAREFNDRLINGKRHFYQYCNLVFGGWDFCIYNEKSANIKHKALVNEIKYMIQSKQMEYERNNRTRHYIYKLFMTRLLINAIVLIMLILSA